MFFKTLLFALTLSTPVMAAGKYKLKSVPHADLDQYLVPGSDATNTPTAVQGLWWLNGNPLPDEMLSLASAKWTEILEDGEVVGYQAAIPVYDEGIWAWHDSSAGRLLYNVVLKSKLTYYAKFNLDFSFGRITPVLQPIGFIPGIEIPSSMLVDFTMTKVSEDEYLRESIVLGQKQTYRFRRVVDGNGNRLPAYDEFVNKAEVPNALLPICDLEGDALPTRCAK
ncbi:MAG: hypothetical protein EOP10_07785 [Proteobacteria bacterium]|nr:MAG: hypothetical protein EOP10_07785 [Pseudomonadota bacterium]